MNLDDKVSVFKDLYKIEDGINLDSHSTNRLISKTKKSIAFQLIREIGYSINLDGLTEETIFFCKFPNIDNEEFPALIEIGSYLKKNSPFKSLSVSNASSKI